MTADYRPPKLNRRPFLFLAIVVGIGGILSYLSVFFPGIFSAILNFFWVIMLISVAIFLVLGFLVIVGLKREVGEFLDVLLEGSLSIIDAIDLIKKLYIRFIEILKDFIYFITPILAIIVSIFVYVCVLLLYKGIGKESDVTLLTVVLTAAMTVAVGILNRPSKELDALEEETWLSAVRRRFKDYFADSFEVIIFIFFLTMDSDKLFFLPKDLNILITANAGDYDLMLRGANVSSQLTATIYLVTMGISIEIIRNIIRLIAVSLNYYRQLPRDLSKGQNIKTAIRSAFADAKDDVLKFITFTTALILVFLLFPRLKLFAMLVASLTGLVLDLVIPGRLKMRHGKDLLSRLLNKAFNFE